MQKIKKGDEVFVLSGKSKGKRGVVLRVLTEENKVIVENVNMVKRHTKGNPAQGTKGSIAEKEMPIHLSNIALWNSVSNRPDRVGFRFLDNGQKVRYFKSNNEVVDV